MEDPLSVTDLETIMASGLSLLRPLLEPHGFTWRLDEVGTGSGGRFIRGAFVRGDRRLELSLRHSLGLVSYQVGVHTLSHEDYHAATAPGTTRLYPAFSSDPLDGFRHLAADLVAFGDAFTQGNGELFAQANRFPKVSRLP